MIGRALALWAVMALPAAAGHFTHDRSIGFSEDGRYFAFKTYGLQRGSGLPFANVFVVDLERNAWVQGSPFRTGRGDEDMAAVEAAPFAALEEVRRDAMGAAAPMLGDLQIRRPATVLYAQGIGQADQADEQTGIRVPNPDRPTDGAPWGEFTLTLGHEEVPAAAEFCTRPEDLRGYRLEIAYPDGDSQTLHQDTRIPASRGCAESYRLDTVLSAGFPQEGTPMVALISVWQQGFEGLERHVIAAPLPPHQRREGQTTEKGAPAPDSMDAALADFLQGFDAKDPDALDAALPARQNADPSSLRWPDAELAPVARAAEVFAAQTGFARHGRLHITQEDIEITPEGAGGPFTLSLIRLRAVNLGAARRADLADIFGSDNVAPPEEFGIGPHVEWRFAMRPVQGMRADIVAAGQREISESELADCGPLPCDAPDALDPDTAGLDCAELGTADTPGTATRAGAALGALQDSAQASEWLIEHGLWQTDAMQIVTLENGRATSCHWTTALPN